MNAKQKEKGLWVDERDQQGRLYAIFNQITPDVDGCTMADFFKGMGVWMVKTLELKAAAGL